MERRKKEAQVNSKLGQNGANLAFEEKLWAPPDKLLVTQTGNQPEFEIPWAAGRVQSTEEAHHTGS